MEERKVDRRILKTKKAIHNAYAELLKIKKSEDITIKDIADVADISRKTFYYYYNGVWEIEDEIENEIINILSKEIESLDIEEIIKNPYLIFQRITEIINMDLDFYGNLIANNKKSKLMFKIGDILETELCNNLKLTLKLEDTTISLISKYIINGLTAVYEDWFNTSRKRPLEEVSKDISSLIFNGLLGFNEK